MQLSLYSWTQLYKFEKSKQYVREAAVNNGL